MAVNIGPRIGIDGEREYRDAIKNIIQQQKTLNAEMKQTAEAFSKSGRSYDTSKTHIEQLTKQIDLQKEKVKSLSDMYEKSAAKTGESSTQTQKWKQALVEAETELQKMESELNSVSGFDGFAKKLEESSNKMKEIGGKLTDAGQQMSMAITAPIVAIGTKGIQKFAEYDKTMTLVRSTMGATAEEAEKMDQATSQAAANSTYSMSDASVAMLNFARAGLDATQASNALAPAMNLAAGEGGNLDTVSNGLVATINGFGDSFANTERYADVFANACNNSALEIDGLSGAMSTAAPIFSTLGYGVQDAALYMGVMANKGIEASEGANALKTGFARLVSPAKDAAEWMKRLDINVTNSDGSMKDSLTVQRELHDAFGTLSESEQVAAASAIFGKNQMSKWLSLINTAPEEVEALSKSIDEEGTSARMAEDMMSGFGGSLEKLSSSVDVAMTAFGEALAPAIQSVADVIQRAVDWFNSLDDSQREVIAQIAIVVAAIGPLLVVLGGIATAIGALMSPVGLAVAGFALLAAAGIALVTHIDQIKAGFESFCETMKTIFTEMWEGLKSDVAMFGDAIANLWNNIVSFFSDVISAAGQFISSIVNGAVQLWNNISNTFNTMKSGIQEIWNNIKDSISNAITNTKNTVSTTVGNIVSAMKDKFNGAKDTVVGIFNTIKDKITSAINTARDKVKSAIDRIKSIMNFSWSLPRLKLPHFRISGGFSLMPPSVPHISVDWYKKAYDNAIAFSRPTVLGTASGLKGFGDGNGNEIVIGQNRLLDTFTQAVQKANTAPAGNTINISVYPSEGMDEEELAELVAEKINDSVARAQGVFA